MNGGRRQVPGVTYIHKTFGFWISDKVRTQLGLRPSPFLLASPRWTLSHDGPVSAAGALRPWSDLPDGRALRLGRKLPPLQQIHRTRALPCVWHQPGPLRSRVAAPFQAGRELGGPPWECCRTTGVLNGTRAPRKCRRGGRSVSHSLSHTHRFSPYASPHVSQMSFRVLFRVLSSAPPLSRALCIRVRRRLPDRHTLPRARATHRQLPDGPAGAEGSLF